MSNIDRYDVNISGRLLKDALTLELPIDDPFREDDIVRSFMALMPDYPVAIESCEGMYEGLDKEVKKSDIAVLHIHTKNAKYNNFWHVMEGVATDGFHVIHGICRCYIEPGVGEILEFLDDEDYWDHLRPIIKADEDTIVGYCYHTDGVSTVRRKDIAAVQIFDLQGNRKTRVLSITEF